MPEDLSEAAIGKLSSKELVALLKRLQPDDPSIAELDVDVIGRNVDPKKLGNDEFAALLSNLGRLADGGADVDLSKMDARNFAKIVARASDDQIKAATAEPTLRARVLDELFRRMSAHFLPEHARDGRVVMQFRITGSNAPGGHDDYAVTIENRAVSVAKELAEHPKSTITLSPPSLLKLATGNAGAKMMFVRGKVKIHGSLGFAAGFMKMFELPKP
jgi:putative sterol carrier protein